MFAFFSPHESPIAIKIKGSIFLFCFVEKEQFIQEAIKENKGKTKKRWRQERR